MLVLEPEKNQINKDFELVNQLVSAEYESALSFLVSGTDAELIEKELIDKWGVGGYDGAVLLLMSRKTLKAEKAEVVLKRWMQQNDERVFKNKISDIYKHLDYFRIRLKFESDDILLSAKLKACSNLIAKIIEGHKDALAVKYRQLVYKDDFGNTILKEFAGELSYFCKNVFAKKYEYGIVSEYAQDILYRKFLQLAESHAFDTDKTEILKIAQRQLGYQYERELENFAQYFCLVHFRDGVLKQNTYYGALL